MYIQTHMYTCACTHMHMHAVHTYTCLHIHSFIHYVTPGAVSPSAQRRWSDLADRKFRENKPMWLAQPLSVFLFGSYPALRETWTERWAGEGQGRVGGCHGPGCCDCGSVLESLFARRYKLCPQYQLNKGVIVAFTCHLSWSVSQLAHKAGKKEECYLLGPLKDPNRSRKPRQNLNNSPSVCSDCMS